MISVEEALRRITGAFRPLAVETIGLSEALGRVLAEDVVARVTQPPAAVSAMDGYAVRAADVTEVPAVLTQVGEAPAGGAYAGTLAAGLRLGPGPRPQLPHRCRRDRSAARSGNGAYPRVDER